MRDFDPTASEFLSSGYLEKSGRRYDPASIGTAVAPSVLGGIMGSDASSSAADAQVQSGREANALQKQMFDQTRADQAPFRQAGMTAQNRLMMLLGLGGTPGGRRTGVRGPQMLQPGMEPNAMRANMSPQFTSQGQGGISNAGGSAEWVNGTPQVDEQGLQAAMQGNYQGNQGDQGNQGADEMGVDSSDPAYGSLMRDFSMADYQADPGLQFRMEQGQEALDRSASSRGGLYSGRAAKDLMRFGQGLGSQEYGAAFNRFQTNRTNKLNPLQSLMGAGQTSANQVGQAGQNYGTSAGQNITGAGNARASGYLAQGNNWQNALNGGVSAWKNNQPQNSLYSGGPVYDDGYSVGLGGAYGGERRGM